MKEGESAPEGEFPHSSGTVCIGRYRLIEQLGQGGMGAVYLAEQQEPIQRHVALKIVRPDGASEERAARFRIERQALASLDHPSVARIYEAGDTEDGVPYFAMEYVPGARTVVEYVEEQSLDLSARLTLFLELCAGVQHGHDRNVVHRDLKPANVLVDPAGRPRIIDYGLARLVNDDVTAEIRLTRTHDVVGTVLYLAPEQVRGDKGDVDARYDVYALGVLLFELLTGELPYDVRGRTALSAFRVIATTEATPASQFNHALPPPIDAILRRALAKVPRDRYPSVRALADDVRHFLDGAPLEPSTFPHRARTWNRSVVVAVASVFAATWMFCPPSERVTAQAASKTAPSPLSVISYTRIGMGTGGFTGHLDPEDFFGSGVTPLGDLDGDGASDAAVGAAYDDDGGYGRGAVWILFLNDDGSVKSHQKISQTSGGFEGELPDNANLGAAVESIGDLDGDGVTDLVVGAGGAESALWVLFLRRDGTVRDEHRIDSETPEMMSMLGGARTFGSSVARLGDVDQDGVADIAAGDHVSEGVAVLMLEKTGRVRRGSFFDGRTGVLGAVVSNPGSIGYSVAEVGDVDGDGTPDVALGAPHDRSGSHVGAAWVVMLASDGRARAAVPVRPPRPLQSSGFGHGLAGGGDFDGDGRMDLLVGMPLNAGGAWIAFAGEGGHARAVHRLDLSSLGLAVNARLGEAIATLGGRDASRAGRVLAGAVGENACFVLQLGSSEGSPNVER